MKSEQLLSRLPVLVAGLLGVVFSGTAGAQGTIRLGFEDEPTGTQPSYVRPTFSRAVVTGTSVTGINAHEGERYLQVIGSAVLRSPNSEPIQSFSLRFYMPDTPGATRFLFGAGNAPGRSEEVGTWQLLNGTFSTPVAEFALSGFIQLGETLPAIFGIDDVRLVTIPEPSTGTIIAMGLAGWVLLRKRAVR